MHADPAGLLAFVNSYGYPMVALLVALAAAGVPVPFPVAAAFVALGALTADPRGPAFLPLAIVATLAAAVGHSADYGLGRAGGPLLRRGLARLERTLGGDALTRLERGLALGGSGTLLIFLTRCALTPLATPVSLLAGAARVPYRRFLALELAGQAIYFTTYMALGRALGPAVAHSLPTTLLLAACIAALVLAPTLVLRLRLGQLRRATASVG